MLHLALMSLIAIEFNVPDVFRPLHISQVSMTSDKTIYVLNRSDKKVYVLDKEGRLVKTFAGAGPGPGELQAPNQIIITEDHCYVTDWFKGYLKFDLNGKFIEGHKPQHPNVIPRKAKGGWVYSRTNQEKKSTELYFCKEDLSDPQLVLTYDDGDKEMFFDLKTPNSVTVEYKPGLERTLWIADKNSPLVYVYMAGANHLIAFDVAQREAVKKIELPFTPQAFNRGWGEKKAEELKGRIQLNGQKVHTVINSHFPENFARVSELMFGPDGKLYIYDGASVMERYEKAMVVSGDRAVEATKGEADVPRRVVAMDRDQAFVLCFNQTLEHPFIKACERKSLAQLLATVPNQELEAELQPINIRLN